MSRYIAGRLRGIHAEPGTLLGPKDITREYLVVVADHDDGVDVGYATQTEVDAAMGREPRSVAEHLLQRRFRR